MSRVKETCSRLHLFAMAFLAVLGTAALLGGCGGGGGGGGTASGASSTNGGQNAPAPNGSEDGAAGGGSAGENGAASGSDGASGKPKPAQGAAGSSDKEKLIAEADEICRRGGKRIQADALKGYSGDLNGSKKRYQEGIESLMVSLEKYVLGDLEAELREVEALEASAPDAQEAQAAAVKARQDLIDLAKSEPKSFIEGTAEGLKEIEAEAAAHGLHACGNVVGEPR